jgi:hypothetical protein
VGYSPVDNPSTPSYIADMAIRRLTRSASSPTPPAGDFQIVIQSGFPRLRGPNGRIYRMRPEPGTPVNPSDFSATLEPAGDENDILLTTTDNTILTAKLEIVPNSTVLEAVREGGDIVATSGGKRVMEVGGVITSDGATPVVFPLMIYAGIHNGKARYTSTGVNDLGQPFSVDWAIQPNQFVLVANELGARWTSSEDVATPDLVTVWTPIYNPGTDETPTGTPTVTAHPATAAQVVEQFDTLPNLTAQNADGSDGTGFVAAATASFGGGTVGTAGEPGDMLFDDDNAYLMTSSGWETLPFDAE